MPYKDLITKARKEFEALLNFYKSEITSIRTNRATPSLVEDILVEYFGVTYKIKELASITVPEPRTLVIQPWDRGALEAIAGAIGKSSIGINPIAEGQSIRVMIPQLTEERRREFIKTLKQKSEETRVKIRRAREEVWDRLQSLQKKGEIREDEKFRGKEELQKAVDEHNKKVEEMEKKKEIELMT